MSIWCATCQAFSVDRCRKHDPDLPEQFKPQPKGITMYKIGSLFRNTTKVYYDILSATFNQEGSVFLNAEDAQALASHLNRNGTNCWVVPK